MELSKDLTTPRNNLEYGPSSVKLILKDNGIHIQLLEHNTTEIDDSSAPTKDNNLQILMETSENLIRHNRKYLEKPKLNNTMVNTNKFGKTIKQKISKSNLNINENIPESSKNISKPPETIESSYKKNYFESISKQPANICDNEIVTNYNNLIQPCVKDVVEQTVGELNQHCAFTSVDNEISTDLNVLESSINDFASFLQRTYEDMDLMEVSHKNDVEYLKNKNCSRSNDLQLRPAVPISDESIDLTRISDMDQINPESLALLENLENSQPPLEEFCARVTVAEIPIQTIKDKRPEIEKEKMYPVETTLGFETEIPQENWQVEDINAEDNSSNETSDNLFPYKPVITDGTQRKHHFQTLLEINNLNKEVCNSFHNDQTVLICSKKIDFNALIDQSLSNNADNSGASTITSQNIQANREISNQCQTNKTSKRTIDRQINKQSSETVDQRMEIDLQTCLGGEPETFEAPTDTFSQRLLTEATKKQHATPKSAHNDQIVIICSKKIDCITLMEQSLSNNAANSVAILTPQIYQASTEISMSNKERNRKNNHRNQCQTVRSSKETIDEIVGIDQQMNEEFQNSRETLDQRMEIDHQTSLNKQYETFQEPTETFCQPMTTDHQISLEHLSKEINQQTPHSKPHLNVVKPKLSGSTNTFITNAMNPALNINDVNLIQQTSKHQTSEMRKNCQNTKVNVQTQKKIKRKRSQITLKMVETHQSHKKIKRKRLETTTKSHAKTKLTEKTDLRSALQTSEELNPLQPQTDQISEQASNMQMNHKKFKRTCDSITATKGILETAENIPMESDSDTDSNGGQTSQSTDFEFQSHMPKDRNCQTSLSIDPSLIQKTPSQLNSQQQELDSQTKIKRKKSESINESISLTTPNQPDKSPVQSLSNQRNYQPSKMFETFRSKKQGPLILKIRLKSVKNNQSQKDNKNSNLDALNQPIHLTHKSTNKEMVNTEQNLETEGDFNQLNPPTPATHLNSIQNQSQLRSRTYRSSSQLIGPPECTSHHEKGSTENDSSAVIRSIDISALVRKRDLDTVYGPHKDGNGEWKFGDSSLKLSEDKIEIGNQKWPLTLGLFELLFHKLPRHYDNAELEIYKQILINTNAYKRGYKSDSQVKGTRAFKYEKIIKEILRDKLRDLKYQRNSQEFADRLKLLISSPAKKKSSENDSRLATSSNDLSHLIITNEIDTLYGPHKDRNGTWTFGDSSLKLSEDKIEIGTQTWPLTPGLLELMFHKLPSNYDKSDLEIYKQILINTNAHKRDYKFANQIKGTKAYKYEKIIKELFKDEPSQALTNQLNPINKGNGRTKLNSQENNYIYWNYINELVDSLKLFTVSKFAGRKNSDLDTLYGPHKDENGEWKFGDSSLRLSEDKIEIGSHTYSLTPGLFELMFHKLPRNYEKSELEIYKNILINTNAHKRNYKSDSQVRGTRAYKYENIIKVILKDKPSQDSVNQLNLTNHGNDMTKTNHGNDMTKLKSQEFVQRLKLLISSPAEEESTENDSSTVTSSIDLSDLVSTNDLDTLYGPHKGNNGSWKFGDSSLRLSEDKIEVGNQTWPRTPGLFELMFHKFPSNYDKNELEIYKKILINANAHKREYKFVNQIKGTKAYKYEKIIKRLFKAESPQAFTNKHNPTYQGSGMTKLSSRKHNYINWSNINELIGRLKLYTVSKFEGCKNRDLDTRYGPHKGENGEWKFGDSSLRLSEDEIEIGNQKWTLTPGLFELMFHKQPMNYDNAELKIYKKILIKTNAHKRGYKSNSQVNGTKAYKYEKIIKVILKDKSLDNSGNHLNHINQVSGNYIYWNDINELVDRLKLFTVSKFVGSKNRDLDTLYGPHKGQNGEWKFGNSSLKLCEDKIEIGNQTWPLTPGLFELLFHKLPRNYDNAELEIYKKILINTNAHKRGYKSDGQVNGTRAYKYEKIIKEIFKDKYTKDSAKQFKRIKSSCIQKVDYQALADRLKLLISHSENNSSTEKSPIDLSCLERKRDLDTLYGPHKDKKGNLKFGNSILKLRKDKIKIRNRRWPLTQGLFELMFHKLPRNYDKCDLKMYKKILMYTNAHKRDYKSFTQIKGTRAYKYEKIIKEIFKSKLS